MQFIISILVSSICVFLASKFVPGIKVDSFGSAIVVAIVLGLLNSTLKPLLTILTIPITILTLGLFLIVINVLMVYLTDALVSGFHVSGFLAAFIFSLVVSVFTYIANVFVD
jgi:putative membrane protein